MGKRRKPTQAISFGDCLKKIEQEFTKLQKSASRFRDFSYFLCARFLNQNLKPGKILETDLSEVCEFADILNTWTDYLHIKIQELKKLHQTISRRKPWTNVKK
mgnify:CR=1 FL=1